MKSIKLQETVTALEISKARIASRNSFDIVSFKPAHNGGVLKYTGELCSSLSSKAKLRTS